MQIRVQILSIWVGVALLVALFQLIRKNRLEEKYALLWVASAVIFIVFSVWRSLLEKLATWVGIYYAPSALFLIALFCGVIIALHFSVVISTLTRQTKMLAQEVALLRQEMEALQNPKEKTRRSSGKKIRS